MSKVLSSDKERTLTEKARTGDADALERLTNANLRFVISIAHQYSGKGLSEDDLISEGNIGLMKAIRRYDPLRGIRLVVYAAPYIRRSIEEAIRDQAQLFRSSDRASTNSPRKYPNTLSIDRPIPAGSSGNFTLQSVIENKDSPQADQTLDRQTLNRTLRQGFAVLDDREQKVISLLYGLDAAPCTMAEAAGKMGLRRERVRQIRNKALRKLKKKLR